MDATLRAKSLPLQGFGDKTQQLLGSKSILGLCFCKPITRSSQPRTWRIKGPPNGASSFRIFAAADFARRRPRGFGSSSKGFGPNSPTETGTQKEKRNLGDNESSVTSTSGIHERASEMEIDTNVKHMEEVNHGMRGEGNGIFSSNAEVNKSSMMAEQLNIENGDKLNGNGSIQVSHDDAVEWLSTSESEDQMEVVSGEDQTLSSAIKDQDSQLVMGVEIKIVEDVAIGQLGLGDDKKSLVASSSDQGNPERSAEDRKSLVRMSNAQQSLVALRFEEKSLVKLDDVQKSIVKLNDVQKSLLIPNHAQVDLVPVRDDEESLVTLHSNHQSPVSSSHGKSMPEAISDDKERLVELVEEVDVTEGKVSYYDEKATSDISTPEEDAATSDVLISIKDQVNRDIHESVDNLPRVEDLNETNGGTGLSRIPDEVISHGIDHKANVMESEEQMGSSDIEAEVKEEALEYSEDTADGKNQAEDPSLKFKLEMEAQLCRQILEELAAKNFSSHNKLFTYPEVVKPDLDIEIFLNRRLSTLKDEPDVLIMGAFNDWRWKSFTLKLEKTHLNDDWWSCKIHVPKEAYAIDFVFFNGKNVYDNNNLKDFHITVVEGMSNDDFENFLLEEKRRELELMVKEQAEKERQAEEQRRMQEEKAAIEADKTQAKLEVDRARLKLQEMVQKAKMSVDNIWYFEPRDFGGDDLVKLYYNKSSGPLAHAKDIWIHGGHNNWRYGISLAALLIKSERKDANWWYAEVKVPEGALVLNWVFANGPPEKANLYDNNNRQDFHAIVPNSIPDEQKWFEEEEKIYMGLRRERRAREEAMLAKIERTARMKAETKERTLKRFLLSQKDVVYTDPLDVQAGNDVTVYYNPANTSLTGKPEIWFRCSFNRWTHRKGPLAPQKMVRDGIGSVVKAVVKVPLDAYMMDFVFSEEENGGLFDNKDGMDYHVPVFGGITKETPMHIVHITVEMAPIAKVGGLGDVVTSLSRAVQDLNHHVDIILPKYDCMNLTHVKDLHHQTSYSWGGTEIKVWFGKVEGLSVYFLEPCNGYFWTGCIYGCRNDGERFGFFCNAALEFLKESGSNPDILHCHDWSSAPVAWLFKERYMEYGLSNARVVFTIHNLEFGAHLIGKAMAYTDKATTVSHTYSKEVARNPVIAPHLYKFHGILNGIDPDIWDPYNDKFIPVAYTSENVIEGKSSAKEALQRKLGLKVGDIPLVGVITRLTHQKGIHLIKHAIWRTLERGGQVILLGSAPDPRIQNDFVNLANQLHSAHNDRSRLCLTYDEPLSHMIYAAADFMLVPSIFEPCGLTQLVAMRYGAIPVVRKTGGLYDTVFDVDHDKERAQVLGLEPNGFSFEGADVAGVDYALNRAITAWYDNRKWFHSLCKQVMEQDWSWNRPALDYLELYHAARKY